MRTSWTRRQVLRGAGVSLSLPWLETFAPRTAKAQAAAAAANKRYVVLYFPNGSAELMSAAEGAGNLLDNTTIHYGSGMHGGNHAGIDLPIALIGGHGGALKMDTFLPWTAGQTLDNVHLTIMQKVFGLSQTSFGGSTGLATDLVA